MGDKEHSILDAIGHTPIVRIGNVYAKLEGVNPSGSIKDRVALEIVEDAERKGELKKGYTIVEASRCRWWPWPRATTWWSSCRRT